MFHFPARDPPSGCDSATVSSAHRHTQGECIDLCSGWLRSATGNGDEQDEQEELPVGGSSDRTGGGVSDSYYDCYIGPSRSWWSCAFPETVEALKSSCNVRPEQKLRKRSCHLLPGPAC